MSLLFHAKKVKIVDSFITEVLRGIMILGMVQIVKCMNRVSAHIVVGQEPRVKIRDILTYLVNFMGPSCKTGYGRYQRQILECKKC